MQSSDLAKLAGVTVRTLRHYHECGLMPEPQRLPNGYRDYTPIDLARLLRIKQLASLGFSLSQIANMLNELDAPASEPSTSSSARKALEQLDCELAAKIESLQEQRRIIEQLRDMGLNPDMPLRFARIWQMLNDQKSLGELDAETRVALLLVGHLYNDKELDELERVVDALADDALAQNADDVHALLENLRPDASSEEIEHVVNESILLLEPIISLFDAENWTSSETDRDLILKSAASEGLKPAQKKAVERIEEEIEGQLGRRTRIIG